MASEQEIMQMPMDILQKYIHQVAIDKGWWETERSLGEIIALLHSELSEALEEIRGPERGPYFLTIDPDGKPHGFAIELADLAIRLFDLCGRLEIDLQGFIALKMKYNEKRPHRHGGKTI